MIGLVALIPLDLGDIGNAIMQPLYWAVSGILVGAHSLVSPIFGRDSGLTWTLSILGLTVVVRTLMTPLYAKQLNSSRAMQALQPRIKALQDKYGSDRERLGQENYEALSGGGGFAHLVLSALVDPVTDLLVFIPGAQ